MSLTLAPKMTNSLYLPRAALTTIFEFFCGDEPVLLPMRATDKRSVLSLVDRGWNDVLQSTTSLWDDILFTSPSSTKNSPDDLLNDFTMCTTMSGNNSLTIAFDMGRHDWPFSIVHSVILPNIHRIKKLTCPIHTNDDIFDFFAISEGQFRALESIEICLIDTWEKPISHFPLNVCFQLNALRTAPRLCDVTAHLYNGLHPIFLHLPWGQLTTLDLGSASMPPEEFMDIIGRGSMQLQEGFFYIKFSKLPICRQCVVSPTEVTMYTLLKLRLRLIYPSNGIHLFSVLHFPALTSMWLEMYDEYQYWDISIYTNLLRSSSNTLRKLHLSDFRPLGFSSIFPANKNTHGSPEIPVRRQQCATSQDSLEKLFNVIPNVDTLYFPLGVFIHTETVEKLVSCRLLPQLCVLGVGASIEGGWQVLSMLKRRYEHVQNISLGSESLLAMPDTLYIDAEPLLPRFIHFLCLLVPHHQYTPEEEWALNEQKRLLGLFGITVHIIPTCNLPLPISK